MWGEARDVVVADHFTFLGEAEEFLAVEAVGVDEDAGAVDDGAVFLPAEEDLVGAEIAVWSTSLELLDLGLV